MTFRDPVHYVAFKGSRNTGGAERTITHAHVRHSTGSILGGNGYPVTVLEYQGAPYIVFRHIQGKVKYVTGAYALTETYFYCLGSAISIGDSQESLVTINGAVVRHQQRVTYAIRRQEDSCLRAHGCAYTCSNGRGQYRLFHIHNSLRIVL